MNDRQETLQILTDYTGLDGVARLIQRGRDPQTARFTIEMTDGRHIAVGKITTLWSQAELGRALAVTIGFVPQAVKAGEWRELIAALIRNATDVEEAPHEALADRVLDWLDQYMSGSATSDRDGAVAQRLPFTQDGELWIHAEHFARWLKREYSEVVTAVDLRNALTDLGFTAHRIQYNASGAGKTRKRTTARYYRGPVDILDVAA